MTNRGLAYPGLADPKRCPWSQVTPAGAHVAGLAREIRELGAPLVLDLAAAPAPLAQAVRVALVTFAEVERARAEDDAREARAAAALAARGAPR